MTKNRAITTGKVFIYIITAARTSTSVSEDELLQQLDEDRIPETSGSVEIANIVEGPSISSGRGNKMRMRHELPKEELLQKLKPLVREEKRHNRRNGFQPERTSTPIPESSTYVDGDTSAGYLGDISDDESSSSSSDPSVTKYTPPVMVLQSSFSFYSSSSSRSSISPISPPSPPSVSSASYSRSPQLFSDSEESDYSIKQERLTTQAVIIIIFTI
ncbi:hypothetical protein RF11_07422 [Thelohanellus kitauei]|uniref:Uncharacterized protein n=1 Tax=Thelohanellus kitauei TaxID=669202 RepID=A0A0C2NEW3_THEKT|nr:hypothetical protein RF11_07422 [Thelohanellus kitauei]